LLTATILTDFNDAAWVGFVENKISRSFPEVDYNFPTLKHPSRQGEDLSEDDDWFAYQGEINNKTVGRVTLNSYFPYIKNKNIVTPFYYLLAPLYKVFKDVLNYNIEGSFVNDKTIQKSMFYHESDSLVKYKDVKNVNSYNPETNEITTETITKNVYKQHLTIHAERFLPEWTVAEYLNNLKNHFNLKISLNNNTKSIQLDFCEDHYFNLLPLDISKFKIEENVFPKFKNTTNYIIKSADGIDLVNVTEDEITNTDEDNTTSVVSETKFKAVPEILSEGFDELAGVGLLLYDYTINDTYAVQELNSQTVSLSGPNGIGERYFKNWYRILLKAKDLPIKLSCSPKQKQALERNEKIYIFNQAFIIKSIEIEEIDNRYLINLDVTSFNP
jgi:hypothetical protein